MPKPKQKDLDGEIIPIQPLTKTRTTEVYFGDYFKVSVPEDAETGEGKLKIDWIVSRMRSHTPIPEGEEGEKYDSDLKKFIRSIR